MVDDARRSEGDLVGSRIVELGAFPVSGNFDVAHLKEINRRLFQDLPSHGYTDVTPGEFRPEPAGPGDWQKTRALEGVPDHAHTVAYSRMDREAIDRLTSVLGAVDRPSLSKLKTNDFVKQFAALYAELDYVHPFSDGNSRTLRAFTQQLAKTCGYDVDWKKFNQNEHGRNLLYIARDLSVNELAKHHARSERTLLRIGNTRTMLEGNRDLAGLLKDVIRPSRAVAFEKWSQEEAMLAFPELKPAYDAKRVAADELQAIGQGQPVTQEAAMREFTGRLQSWLNAGEFKDFSKGRPLQRDIPSPAASVEKTPQLGRDR